MKLHLTIDFNEATLAQLASSGLSVPICGTISAVAVADSCPNLNSIVGHPNAASATVRFAKKHGFTATMICEESGISAQSVQRMFRGAVRMPHPRTLKSIILAICRLVGDSARVLQDIATDLHSHST
jgi:hypothetical protein